MPKVKNLQPVSVTHPHLLKEWHPTLNEGLNPDNITAGSDKEIHWQCQKFVNHVWSTPLSRRAKVKPTGCSICSNKQILVGFNDLTTTHPELAKQWHPTKNGGLTPEMVISGSHKDVWWLGECGHEWPAAVKFRAKGVSCPVCKNKKTLTGFNDLATTHPNIAEQWHPTKNGELTPAAVTAGSHKNIWWLGECGHEWSAKVYSRKSGHGCPTCSGHNIAPGDNDFVTKHPDVASKWHPTKNTTKEPPTDLSSADNKQIFWWTNSTCEHHWKGTVASEIKRKQCPYCSNQKTLTGFNDLATTHPEIAAMVSKKSVKQPSEIMSSYPNPILFSCEKNHEWEASPLSLRQKKNIKCPVCDGRELLTGFNDIATTNPELAAQWHPTKNGNLTPASVTRKSYTPIVWVCEKGHESEATIPYRLSAKGNCAVCTNQKLLTGFNDLATTNPEIAAQWHPTKNGELKPTQIIAGNDDIRIWWLGECGHEWDAVTWSRTGKQQTGCSICAGQSVLTGFNDLAALYPEIAAQWHPTKNITTPDKVMSKTSTPAWWLCAKGHEWKTAVAARTGSQTNCPVCSNQKLLVGFNDLTTTHPEVIELWHPAKNTANPGDYVHGSGHRPWWICEKGHEWQAYIYAVTAGSRCPTCTYSISKAEIEMSTFLKNNLPSLSILTSQRDVIGKYELDIYIPEKNLAIEFNGLYWHSERAGKTREYHYNKYQQCKSKGIQLIQIWEDDWLENKAFIKQALLHKLQENTQPSIGARKLKPTELDYKQAATFLLVNHIQGPATGTKYYGLTSPETGLRAVIVLKRSGNKGHEGEWLIERYATSGPTPGGFTKLLKHAEKELAKEEENIKTWVTFSDNCISDGGLYENNNFVKDKELEPDYMYVIGNKRIHKFNYRLKRFREDPNLLWDETLSEKGLAELNNIPRIWDAGKIRWVRAVS